MASLSAIRDLLTFTIRADGVVVSAALRMEEEDVQRDTGSSFGSVLSTLAHVLGSEQLWLSRFVGNPLDRLPGGEDYPSVEALVAGFLELRTEQEVFLASLTEVMLAAELAWVDLAGRRHAMPLWKPVLHMTHHSAYHRGQAISMMRQLGYEPPSADLIDFFAER